MDKNQAITKTLSIIESCLHGSSVDIGIKTTELLTVKNRRIIKIIDHCNKRSFSIPYQIDKKLIEAPNQGTFVAVWIDDEKDAIPKISAGKFDKNGHLLCIEAYSDEKFSDWPNWRELEYKKC